MYIGTKVNSEYFSGFGTWGCQPTLGEVPSLPSSDVKSSRPKYFGSRPKYFGPKAKILASASKVWPRPRSFGLGLALKHLASAWPRSRLSILKWLHYRLLQYDLQKTALVCPFPAISDSWVWRGMAYRIWPVAALSHTPSYLEPFGHPCCWPDCWLLFPVQTWNQVDYMKWKTHVVHADPELTLWHHIKCLLLVIETHEKWLAKFPGFLGDYLRFTIWRVPHPALNPACTSGLTMFTWFCILAVITKATGNYRSESQKFPPLSVEIPENPHYENIPYTSRV